MIKLNGSCVVSKICMNYEHIEKEVDRVDRLELS